MRKIKYHLTKKEILDVIAYISSILILISPAFNTYLIAIDEYLYFATVMILFLTSVIIFAVNIWNNNIVIL